MKKYSVEITKNAEKELKALDRNLALLIYTIYHKIHKIKILAIGHRREVYRQHNHLRNDGKLK